MIKVNHQSISENQILQEMQYHPAADHRSAMIEAAESLIISELLQQRASQLGLLPAASSNDAEQQTDSLLEQLIDQEVTLPKASETECQQYYQNNLAKFCTSPLIAARHILLAAPEHDEPLRAQVSEQAQALIEQLKQGSDFAVLAAQYSACDSSKVGGQLGQLSKGQTVTEFERQVFSAEPGLITHPVETRFGVHIVFVDEKVNGQQLPFDMVKERIADYLNEKVERKALAQYIQQLIANADIEGFDFNVDSSPLMQ